MQQRRPDRKTLSSGKLVAFSLLLIAASCAPKSNHMRGFVGEMRSPEFYQEFDNWENDEDGTFETTPEQHNHGLPADTDLTDTTTTTTPPTTAPTTTTPPQPEAAGPATPSDLPNADANYPYPKRQTQTQTQTPPQKQENESRPSTHTPAQPVERETKTPDQKSKTKKEAPKTGNGNCMTADSPCFPVAGKNWFMDGFGAARSGGRRHAGIDIFALKLVPVVAVEDGVIDVVKVETRGLSGNYIGINHGNGVRTLYMHLNNDSPGTNDGRGHGIVPGIKVGLHVKKGQHIGWVGNSGNAETTPPHLHFEMRVSDNRNAIRMREFYPTNPFKFLRTTEPKKKILISALNY